MALGPLVVTLSAPYGAGGSEIGPRLAERLGLTFIDRAIPAQVAERLAIPLEEALEADESPPAALERLLHPFATLGLAMAGAMPQEELEAQPVPQATEQVIRERAEHSGGVVLGRAGAIVLAGRPGTLHVRLTGPAERRVEQAMRIEGIDREAAERRLEQTDRAREAYVSFFYHCDATAPEHYHLVLDSTALPADCCVDLIAEAARRLRG